MHPDPAPPTDRHGLALLEVDDFASYELLFGEGPARSILKALENRVAPTLPAARSVWNPGRGKVAISLPGIDATAIRDLARRMQRLVAGEALDTAIGNVFVTVSAGCALSDTAALGLLGPTAEAALAEARQAGHGRCRIRTAERRPASDEATGAAAINAVRIGRISFAYQPVHPLDDERPPAFLECLARLPNDGAEAVEAARFLPSVVDAGLGAVLDRQALARALDLLAANPRHRLSVNVGRATMQDREWLALLTARTAVDLTLGERLIVEIAEPDVLAAPALVAGFLASIRPSGAALALDRFGEGAAAPAEFEALRFDMVKLSSSICHGIAGNTVRQLLARGRIARAAASDLMIVACGIEREDDARWLTAEGATHGQGRLFGRPDSFADLRSPRIATGTGVAAPARVSPYRA